MNKEQFLAMNLPHKVKAIFTDEYGVIRIHELDHYLYQYMCDSQKDDTLYKFKLILHPLTDLKKDEWIEKLNTFACELLDAAHVYDEKNVIGLNWMTQPFEVVMWLIEHHFDIAGLIEKGEAIDVNILPDNPYKTTTQLNLHWRKK